MKKYFSLFLMLVVCQKLAAQKVVDKVIDDNDRKKVERARKLYNEFKIFEGEKILKELVKQNPRQVYFYEALVQMQRQVLYRIKDASGELQEMNISKAAMDSLKNEEDADVEEKKSDVAEAPANTKEIFESLGLDMARINVKDEPKKSQQTDEDEIDKRTDATVTIDSSLIMSEDEKAAFAKDRKGSIKKIDKKTQRKLKILESFAQIPYDAYLYDMLQNARNATRLFSNADSSSLYLRQFLIDTFNVNQEVHQDAWAEYLQGLDAYYEKMIPDAAKHLEKALELDDIFYTAHLRLGDIYYLMNKDTAAVLQYKYAAVLNPEKTEPYEKLAIMQYNRGRFTDAAATMITAIMKYPQSHYNSLLRRIVEKTGHTFDSQWLPREVFPLSTTNVQEEIIVNDKSPWWHYQAARNDVFNYYDTTGIVIPNDKTEVRYLEVYAWKKMLNNSSPKLFQFARAMDKVGYLDCYVLITLFHNDLYGQFKDFVALNDDKIKKYFYLLINWEDAKFDKIRKSVEVKVPEKTDDKKTDKKK
jgi:Flp pilus assembly protein TadD